MSSARPSTPPLHDSEPGLPSAAASTPDTEAVFSGDRARRRAGFGLLVLAVGLFATWQLFSRLPAIWPHVEALDGTVFLLAATALGAALALAPLSALIGLALALWLGVESVYRPRRQPSIAVDRLIVAFGLTVWFSPTLACLAIVARALQQGRVHFVRPPRDYFLATDPIAFWQSIGFWLIMAAVTGFLAWSYWRGKLRSRPVQP